MGAGIYAVLRPEAGFAGMQSVRAVGCKAGWLIHYRSRSWMFASISSNVTSVASAFFPPSRKT